tara:strand:+ start:2250 stop:3308 length:1059 start_codon:yes stop_codon:yes gene_type:complete
MGIKNFINKKPYIIAGPCSVESESQVLDIASSIYKIANVFRAGVWKPRTSPSSFEGIGEKGLKWLSKVKEDYSLKVATEVATARHVDLCLKHEIDILWIGARTTVNPFYVQEIAEALKGVKIPVFVKNPIHPDLGLWIGAIERLNKSGISELAAIHRGFYSYDKLMFRNDPKWEVPIKLKEKIKDIPIICDPSHIAGKANLVEDICQTAMDINLDGLMIETHNNPLLALSDVEQQITPVRLKQLVRNLVLRRERLSDKDVKMQLMKMRDRIDVFDLKIVELLKERQDAVEEIALFKKKNQLTIFQLQRWYDILKTRKAKGKDLDIDEKMISELFSLIHKYSILTQTNIMRNI